MTLSALSSYKPSSKLEIELEMPVPAKKPKQDRIETPSPDAFSPADYRLHGLRVLARIITRIHMQRSPKNQGIEMARSGENHRHNPYERLFNTILQLGI